MRKNHSVENYPPLRVKIKETFSRVSAHAVIPALLALSLLAASCVYDRYDTDQVGVEGMAVELNIMTRAISSDAKDYEAGTNWENYIDIENGDYKIYFFTNDKDDAAAESDAERNTLITEFQPKGMTAVEGTNYAQYTLTGDVDKVIAEYPYFKVVVLANWGAYPTVTAGETTIDSLVEGTNTTFSAETFLSGVDSSHLIPFYGVREYSGVEWKDGWRIALEGDITLLRAVAKVEVVMSEDSDFSNFESVSIAGYNSTGYCAPKGVYLRADYDSEYTNWAGDFANTIHLVDGANESGASSKTYPFNQQTGTTADTWTIYLPEYDNLTGACSSIRLSVFGTEYEIYFANYSDGEAETTADYDIFRNYLYRFRVKVLANLTIMVFVDTWDEYFDNEYTFEGAAE